MRLQGLVRLYFTEEEGNQIPLQVHEKQKQGGLGYCDLLSFGFGQAGSDGLGSVQALNRPSLGGWFEK